jgi:uncharacterized membrane protein
MKYLLAFSLVFVFSCNQSSKTTNKPETDSVNSEDRVANVHPDTSPDLLSPSVTNTDGFGAQEKKAGASWTGTGTEPFWYIKRVKDSIYFNQPGWKQPLALKTIRKINSKDSVVYVSRNDSTYLETVIYPGTCSDGMSDRKYDYAMKVVFNKTVFKGCATVF